MSLQQELYKLYNANSELEQLYQVIEEELEGDVSDDFIRNQLIINRENVELSLFNLLELRNILQSQINYTNEEIARLGTIGLQRQKEINKIEEYIQSSLIQFGEKDKKGVIKMDLTKYKLSTRKSQVVEIGDEGLEKLPAEFIKWESKLKLDSESYLLAKTVLLEKGIDLEGNPVPDKVLIKKTILEDAENDEGKTIGKETLQSEKVIGAFVRNKLNLIIK